MADVAPAQASPGLNVTGLNPPGMAAPARPWRRVATGVAVVLAVAVTLGLVYAAWQNPHLAVDLANAVWSCF